MPPILQNPLTIRVEVPGFWKFWRPEAERGVMPQALFCTLAMANRALRKGEPSPSAYVNLQDREYCYDEQWVNLQCGRICYMDAGRKASGDTSVVVIHGFGTDYNRNRRIYPALLDAGRRVVAPDLIGCGKSDKPKARYTIPYFTSMLKEFLDHLSIERAALIGHSLGAAIAVDFALEYPENVAQLGLISAACIRKPPLPIDRLTTWAFLNGGLGTYIFRATMSATIHNRSPLALTAIHETMGISNDPEYRALQHSLTSSIIDGLMKYSVSDRLPELKTHEIPMFVIWGNQDRFEPTKLAYVIRQVFPDISIELLENCGHHPMLEQPDTLNEALLKHLIS